MSNVITGARVPLLAKSKVRRRRVSASADVPFDERAINSAASSSISHSMFFAPMRTMAASPWTLSAALLGRELSGAGRFVFGFSGVTRGGKIAVAGTTGGFGLSVTIGGGISGGGPSFAGATGGFGASGTTDGGIFISGTTGGFGFSGAGGGGISIGGTSFSGTISGFPQVGHGTVRPMPEASITSFCLQRLQLKWISDICCG
jgi:hypothetical protein